MKGALHDKFLLALLGLLLLAVIAVGYLIFQDHGPDFAPGQNLTEEQKIKVLRIALDDAIVMEDVYDMAYGHNTTYHILGIRGPARFYETGPGYNRSRILPALEIAIGDEDAPGQNLLAFVDLKENRVAYIGFIERADRYHALPAETFENKSIVNTGYRYGRNLTGGQKADAVTIALGDKKVRGQLNGKNYSLNGVGMTGAGRSGPGYDYVEVYPAVSFMVGKAHEPGYMLTVLVDINKRKVIDVTACSRPPVPPEAPDSTGSASTG